LFKFLIIAAIVLIGLIFVVRRFGRARVEPQPTRPTPPLIAGNSGTVTAEVDGQEIDIDPSVMADIRALLAEGNKIEAIKRVREATGLGLTEAKQFVESLDRLRK
jgi:large subunit ribosomal protein L7/L12